MNGALIAGVTITYSQHRWGVTWRMPYLEWFYFKLFTSCHILFLEDEALISMRRYLFDGLSDVHKGVGHFSEPWQSHPSPFSSTSSFLQHSFSGLNTAHIWRSPGDLLPSAKACSPIVIRSEIEIMFPTHLNLLKWIGILVVNQTLLLHLC